MAWTTDDALDVLEKAFSQVEVVCNRTKGRLRVRYVVNSEMSMLMEFKRQYRSIDDDIECFMDFQPHAQCALIYALLERKRSKFGEIFCYSTSAWELAMGTKITSTKLRELYGRGPNEWKMRSRRSSVVASRKIVMFFENEIIPIAEKWNSLDLLPLWEDPKTMHSLQFIFSHGPRHWAILNFAALASSGRYSEAAVILEKGRNQPPSYGGSAATKWTMPNDWAVFEKNATRFLSEHK
jgi:hypothetical protein